MITENRWQHILGTARKAKRLAEKWKPGNKQFAEDMFLLGMLHDLGYEFPRPGEDHSATGAEILKRQGYRYWREVAGHGHSDIPEMSDELFILNCADMTTGTNGESCSMEERIRDIGDRHGYDSDACQRSILTVKRLQSDPRYAYLKNKENSPA